jgi:RarD protein
MYLLLFLQQLIASGTHIVSKNLTLTLQEPQIILIRGIISGTIYALWILYKRKSLIRIEKKDIFLLSILGLLNIPLNQYVFFIAIKHTTPPNVALAYAITPVFVLIISHFYFKEKITKLKLAGIVISISGSIILLLEKGLDGSSQYLLGNSLALIASFSWALYTILGRKFSLKYGPIYSTGLSMIWGLILFIPIFFVQNASLNLSSIDTFSWLNLLYVGVITSVIGYAMWYFALSKMDASRVAVFNNLQPILTTILSIIIFNQEISSIFIIGGITVLIGVFVTQRK